MSQAIVSAQGLTKTYAISRGFLRGKHLLHALVDCSFEMFPGQTLAVVGESGCGKSTLARAVTLIEQPSAGTLTINGVDASPAHWPSLRSTVQIVFQNPYGSLNPRQRIGAMLQEPLVINRPDLNAAQREAQARAMLERVGLRPEHFDRYPHMFSGGQRQRIAVARALMLSPKVVVLDEPVSALDLSIQSQILNLLLDLQEEMGLSYLFISHDLSVVKHMADQVMVMYLGRVVEQASKTALFAQPRHPYTQALLSATPNADPLAKRERIKLQGELPSPMDVPTGCAFAPRCWKAQARCTSERPSLSTGEHAVACFFAG
jgi:dipeptide transport system ATP-binding protein